MDFGQYTNAQVVSRLKPRKGSGKCDRCGAPTRTKTILGATICNKCWKK